MLPTSEFPFWFKIEPHGFSLYLTLFGKSVCNSHGQQAQTLPILKLYKLPTIGAAEWLIGMQLVVEFIVSRGSERGGGGPLVGCRLKFIYFLGSRLKISILVGCRLISVNK